MNCPCCAGTGEIPCPDCDETGFDFGDGGQCDRCGGTGDAPCPECNGESSQPRWL